MNPSSGYPVVAERCQVPGREDLANFLAETDDAVEILSVACGVLIRALPITDAVLTVPDDRGVNRAVARAGPQRPPAPPRPGRRSDAKPADEGGRPAAPGSPPPPTGVGDLSGAVRVPVRVGVQTLGWFEVYPAGTLSDDHLEVIHDCAAVTGHLIHGMLRHRDAERTCAQLQHALTSRVVIEQAKGVIAHRDQISPDEAFERMRRHARNHNLKVHELAHQILDAVLTTEAVSRV
jgi:hypothetical protein